MIVLTIEAIDLNSVLEHVTAPECGAEVLFVGTTRQFTSRAAPSEDAETRTLETEFLTYEAYHEMATHQLEQLANKAKHRWPVQRVAIVHRLGKVLPQEASVAVAVSCPHRSEAFEAAKWLIDTIKHDVPIWKQEHYVQNGPEWIHPTSGSCRCDSPDPTIAQQQQ
ncbi:MAG: molybdenum cofactor biosynthesis protein MoaE [Aureliella sp.]